MKQPTPEQIKLSLSQFTGSESFLRYSSLFSNAILTEGTAYLAEFCACYWLMDKIAANQHDTKIAAEEFQVWELRPPSPATDQLKWVVHGDDGNGNSLFEERLDYTDFPLPEGIKLYAARNELGGITIMLPSEY